MLCQSFLPFTNFEWCEMDINKIVNYDTGSEAGYILDVALEYPKELHGKRNDYQIAPELLKVTADTLSSQSEETYTKCNPHHKRLHDEQTEN